MLPFTPDELDAAVADGRVTKRQHQVLPLFIYNYSPEVQYTQKWDDITLSCRGLILDAEYNVVARPWKKFFNLGQVNLPIQFDDPVEVMDKADGSLGILYPIHDSYFHNNINGYAISTRGSFASEQAIHATEVWQTDYAHLKPLPDYTMLFEIVYPENRIVLDYGDFDGLVLLGAVQNSTGYYLGPNEARYMFVNRYSGESVAWPDSVVEVFPYNSISEAMSYMERPNAEGFVIRSHNFMVKLKQPDYLELHRLVTNASPKTVWEQLKQGKSKSEIISAFPDEFHSYIEGMIDPLLEAFDRRFSEIMENYQVVVQRAANIDGSMIDVPRKNYANVFKKHRDGRYFFLLLDERPIRDVLWTELKPRQDT